MVAMTFNSRTREAEGSLILTSLSQKSKKWNKEQTNITTKQQQQKTKNDNTDK